MRPKNFNRPWVVLAFTVALLLCLVQTAVADGDEDVDNYDAEDIEDTEDNPDGDDSEESEEPEDGDTDKDTDKQTGRQPCESDSDCIEQDVCRDDGFCLPLECDEDSDCRYAGFHCRMDNICAPDRCTWDTDCLRGEFCLNHKCVSNPANYVEGGASNCQGLALTSRWEQIGVILIGILLLLWLRRRQSSRR